MVVTGKPLADCSITRRPQATTTPRWLRGFYFFKPARQSSNIAGHAYFLKIKKNHSPLSRACLFSMPAIAGKPFLLNPNLKKI